MSTWRALAGDRALGKLERALRAAALAAMLVLGALIVHESLGAAGSGAAMAGQR